MNYSLYEIPNETQIPIKTVFTQGATGTSIPSMPLAVCSILLSSTGCFVALQKSRCKNINFFGLLQCGRVLGGQQV